MFTMGKPPGTTTQPAPLPLPVDPQVVEGLGVDTGCKGIMGLIPVVVTPRLGLIPLSPKCTAGAGKYRQTNSFTMQHYTIVLGTTVTQLADSLK